MEMQSIIIKFKSIFFKLPKEWTEVCNAWNFTPTLKVWAVNWAGCRRRRSRCSIMLWTSHSDFLAFNGGLQSINNQEKMIFNCYFSSFSASLVLVVQCSDRCFLAEPRRRTFPLWIENKSIYISKQKGFKKFWI